MNTSDSFMKDLINDPTCYKNFEKPSCIDLILTNQPTLLQRSAGLDSPNFIYSQ